jgi:hypothetical protein
MDEGIVTYFRVCGTGAGFLQVLRFPLPIFIPPISPQSPSSIIWGLYNRPEVAAVPSGLSPTPLIKKYIKKYFRVLSRFSCRGREEKYKTTVVLLGLDLIFFRCHLVG